ncbi:hypothetical protein QBC37DRAFT_36139 [Rhypophila decipiens]|uniref:Uncharacterized protein n=1 Tax=Rhypophila decipiens TaxID=261697 RepID=A0AAN6Y2U3_9PEZI|nr:hypothetical protein QBC37DRAFT_36139 [Rhypophila decipiens]
MNPWMTSDMHPSMLGNGMTSDGQYVATTASNGAWGQPIPTSAPDQAWGSAFDYGSMNNQHDMQSSRDASPNDDYFGTAEYSNGSSWDTSSQPMYSPYSEVPPQISGLGNSTNVAISPMENPHHHAYSSAAQISATTTTLSLPASQKTSSTKPSKSSKQKSQSPTTTSSTSKSKSSYSNKRKASSSASSKTSRDSKYLPQEVHRIASEHISREAWRICKAEAIEMEQRRVQLLQNGSGTLEREMLQQRHDLGLIRQGVLREQGVLEDALKRAERLGKSQA